LKILITGSTGFIGKNLVEYYNSPENTIIEYIKWEDVFVWLNLHKPDLILHCAAEIYDESSMFVSNVQLTQNILMWVKKNPETKMIYIGSSAEYGIMYESSKETHPINPYNVYQATKGAATLLCQGYAREYNLNLKIARVYSAFGNHEKPRRLFPTLYRAFFKNESFHLYEGYHDFIYIKDFIRGIDMLIKSPKNPGEIVNFGSGIQSSNLEVLNTWKNICDTEPPIIYHNEITPNKYESSCWVCNTEYAQSSLGFKTEFTLTEGIKDFIKIQGEHAFN
jgi:nucleoside-diphosphate-sugar epimerase